ncbi:MAG: glycosyltransferase family 4 protein [Aphanothece sp. CMT-3BRIN-NPC111]|jgi:glycosyltransferase involved in cell wall biosynthesis|nr:glycosyltransferase family 4 protein [Aphanothece sp. CMT-3BRIN-NPC111]
MNQPRLAYISFDIVPAPKGAAIHIAAFAQALAGEFGGVHLVTVSPTSEPTQPQELWQGVIQTTLPAIGDTLINRVLYFRTMLGAWWQGRRFEAVHIRSIYEGFPIALNKKRLCDKLIFEVNGLPSIELKYRYPAVADDRELLQKLKAQEQICLDASDLIVTPSCVTRDYLQTRDVPASKIRVIPNGVDLDVFTYDPEATRKRVGEAGKELLPYTSCYSSPFRLLYFGTLSAWQGVNLAVEALALACRDFPVELMVIGIGRDRTCQTLKQLALKLGVANQLTILPPVSQAELVGYLHSSDAVVAPLTPNDRNLVQGCCPLKVLEAMGSGTPIIASDLPVVRELGIDGVHFLLVKPGSAKGIKDALMKLWLDPGLGSQLAVAARQRIENYYTWKQAGNALVEAYEELGITRASTSCSRNFSTSREYSA